MATVDDGDFEVQSASEDVKFYYQWSLDARRKIVEGTNDALKQTLTLATTLCGGSFLLANQQFGIETNWRLAATFAFLLAIPAAFFGSLPFRGYAPLDRPDVFRRGVEAALKWKTRSLVFATFCIVAGLAFALVGAWLYRPN